MARNVADLMWEMLQKAGVKRCYGIVGDALNPVIDALRRNGNIEFIHVRHEEYGVFAAVAEAYLTGHPVDRLQPPRRIRRTLHDEHGDRKSTRPNSNHQ